jgi:hypothetical protein
MRHKSQVEAARHQPPGAGRRAEIRRNAVEIKTAIMDDFIGPPACFDTYAVHYYQPFVT